VARLDQTQPAGPASWSTDTSLCEPSDVTGER
jgi:hypothetical protein